MSFGARLKSMLSEKRLSQARLAELSGVSQQAISKIVTTNGDPQWSTVCALAAALDVSTDQFCPGGGGAPVPPSDRVVSITIHSGDRADPTRKRLTEVVVTAEGALVPRPRKSK